MQLGLLTSTGVTKHRTANTARTARGALTARVTKHHTARTARTASRNTAPRQEIITAPHRTCGVAHLYLCLSVCRRVCPENVLWQNG